MNDKISAIFEKIKDLETELEDEINRVSERLTYTIEKKKILFEKSVIDYHRKFRKNFYRFIREASIVHGLTAPFIYGLAAPLILIDLSVSPGFRFVKRSYDKKRRDHQRDDRHQLYQDVHRRA
ncbi:MAG TPA: hypothetical protein ENI77_10170 [Nitrospirae bacterium]|nr:hypothetical protein [Nitrospirota bacterium]